jgi:hypothetical protein
MTRSFIFIDLPCPLNRTFRVPFAFDVPSSDGTQSRKELHIASDLPGTATHFVPDRPRTLRQSNRTFRVRKKRQFTARGEVTQPLRTFHVHPPAKVDSNISTITRGNRRKPKTFRVHKVRSSEYVFRTFRVQPGRPSAYFYRTLRVPLNRKQEKQVVSRDASGQQVVSAEQNSEKPKVKHEQKPS